jgi:hypothetical protein
MRPSARYRNRRDGITGDLGPSGLKSSGSESSVRHAGAAKGSPQ